MGCAPLVGVGVGPDLGACTVGGSQGEEGPFVIKVAGERPQAPASVHAASVAISASPAFVSTFLGTLTARRCDSYLFTALENLLF